MKRINNKGCLLWIWRIVFILLLSFLIGFQIFSQGPEKKKGNYRYIGYVQVDDSLISSVIIMPEVGSLPVNPRVGRMVVYNDTLRQWTGLSWLKIGSSTGTGADPHITDSTIYIEEPVGGNYFAVNLERDGGGYFENYYRGPVGNSGYYVTWDSTYFNWNVTPAIGGENVYEMSFGNMGPGVFFLLYKGDTVLLADTIGLSISNEDSSEWDDNNVITKKYFDQRNRDYHITDSSLFIQKSAYNYLKVDLSPFTNPYFDNYGYFPNHITGYAMYWDSAYFMWTTYDHLGNTSYLMGFGQSAPGVFGLSYKSDTILIADTLGMKISNEDSSSWDDNNVITKAWFEDRIYIQPSGSLTDGAPTDSEIDAIIGSASGRKGYKVTVKDSDGSGRLYIVESDGTDWYYIVMTKAL